MIICGHLPAPQIYWAIIIMDHGHLCVSPSPKRFHRRLFSFLSNPLSSVLAARRPHVLYMNSAILISTAATFPYVDHIFLGYMPIIHELIYMQQGLGRTNGRTRTRKRGAATNNEALNRYIAEEPKCWSRLRLLRVRNHH